MGTRNPSARGTGDELKSGEAQELVETSIAVSEWNTVAPGPQEIWARFATVDGEPVQDAIVTATGDSNCLPINLEETQSGRYGGTVEIRPDSDGMRDTIEVRAYKGGFAPRTAYVSYFTTDDTWTVRNDQVERRLLHWSTEYEKFVGLEHFTTYEGYRTYVATLTDKGVPDTGKTKLMFTQSHAHEPGGTAALMDVLNQILTGQTQAGRTTRIERDRILEEMLIVAIPIGNASGRERCPVQYWSEQFDHDAMNSYIYGRLRGADSPWMPSPSILQRSLQDLDPAYPVPQRYEQVDKDTFAEPFYAPLPAVLSEPVDPTRYEEIVARPEQHVGYSSAQGRIVKTMLDRHAFKAAVDLHQMTREGDLGQVHIREGGLKGYNQVQLAFAHRMATRIEDDWRRQNLGMDERCLINREGWRLNLTDFIHLYGEGNPASFLVEVTKGPGTTKRMQKKIALSAIESVIDYALSGP